MPLSPPLISRAFSKVARRQAGKVQNVGPIVSRLVLLVQKNHTRKVDLEPREGGGDGLKEEVKDLVLGGVEEVRNSFSSKGLALYAWSCAKLGFKNDPRIWGGVARLAGVHAHGLSLKEKAQILWAMSTSKSARKGRNDDKTRSESLRNSAFEEFLDRVERIEEEASDGQALSSLLWSFARLDRPGSPLWVLQNFEKVLERGGVDRQGVSNVIWALGKREEKKRGGEGHELRRRVLQKSLEKVKSMKIKSFSDMELGSIALSSSNFEEGADFLGCILDFFCYERSLKSFPAGVYCNLLMAFSKSKKHKKENFEKIVFLHEKVQIQTFQNAKPQEFCNILGLFDKINLDWAPQKSVFFEIFEKNFFKFNERDLSSLAVSFSKIGNSTYLPRISDFFVKKVEKMEKIDDVGLASDLAQVLWSFQKCEEHEGGWNFFKNVFLEVNFSHFVLSKLPLETSALLLSSISSCVNFFLENDEKIQDFDEWKEEVGAIGEWAGLLADEAVFSRVSSCPPPPPALPFVVSCMYSLRHLASPKLQITHFHELFQETGGEYLEEVGRKERARIEILSESFPLDSLYLVPGRDLTALLTFLHTGPLPPGEEGKGSKKLEKALFSVLAQQLERGVGVLELKGCVAACLAWVGRREGRVERIGRRWEGE